MGFKVSKYQINYGKKQIHNQERLEFKANQGHFDHPAIRK